MQTLIIKLGAAGDVLRTTPLLHILQGDVDWITSDNHTVLLKNLPGIRTCIAWKDRSNIFSNYYDLVISLEDALEIVGILENIKYKNLFGAYRDSSGSMKYTDNSQSWFDMSIISAFGKEKADQLKYQNRRSYQELVFTSLGHQFTGQSYSMVPARETELCGDIAIAPLAGSVWPMKNWAYYEEFYNKLKYEGYIVNFLPKRDNLLEHMGDIKNHKYLVSGDSLPMHIALGYGIKCLSIFI